jgi:hypothetical protein
MLPGQLPGVVDSELLKSLNSRTASDQKGRDHCLN